MKSRFIKRTLTKGKNGRHRILSAEELRLTREATSLRSDLLQQKRHASLLQQQIEGFLDGDLTQALPPKVRQQILDNMTGALVDAFGEQITKNILPQVRQSPKLRGLALDARIQPGFGPVPNNEVMLEAYIDGFSIAVAHRMERRRR